MTKVFALLALTATLLIVAVGLGVVPPTPVQAQEEVSNSAPCAAERVALDEGYGVSRTVVRQICAH